MSPLSTSSQGCAYLIGCGPGALGLVTLRARQLIERADVILYDYLCNPQLLSWARPDARVQYVGKQAGNHALPQSEINALIVAEVKAGRQVARLKGGDPYVFGRGGEEAQELRAAGLRFEVVPGISSTVAAPAYAGIPVTHRDFTSSLTIVTGHEDPTKTESALDYAHLARDKGTKIILMGIDRLRAITGELLAHGAAAETPVALVRWGTYPHQQTLVGTLATIATIAEAHGFKAPAVTIIGDVVRLREELAWFESRPLFGKRIVVTRTRNQASQLAEQLTELGAEVLEIPTIRIVPRVLSEEERQLIRSCGSRFDWVVFTSPNAVEAFFALFLTTGWDVRKLGAVKLGVIGPATAKALAKVSLCADLMPEVFTSDGLAAALATSINHGARVLLPVGNLVDDRVERAILQAGGSATRLVVYDTVPETQDTTGARARYLEAGADWITFTSASTVENWLALGLTRDPGLPRARHLSIGPSTSAALRARGLAVDAEAAEATLDAMVDTLTRLAS